MADIKTKMFSIRISERLWQQLEEQSVTRNLKMSDYVRRELSLIKNRIKDNEFLRKKIMSLLLQIYGVITEQDKNKVDLSKYEEIQAHTKKVEKELKETEGKVSLLLGSNKQMKELLDLKISIIQKYEDQAEKAEQVDDNDIEREEKPLPGEKVLPPLDQTEDEVPEDDGWNGLEE